MAYCRDHRSFTLKDRPGNDLLIKGPQIFHGSAASSHDQYIQSHRIQSTDSIDNAELGILSLYQGRIKDQLDIRIPSCRNVYDIMDRRSGTGRDDSYGFCIFGDRFFILCGKHAHLFQLVPQFLETFK